MIDDTSTYQLSEELHAGGEPTFDEIVGVLREAFPLLDELRSTPQDPRWHAEGDVHVHTSMVLEELYDVMRNHNRELSANERVALIYGAVFHDIAKPLTTVEREFDGEVRLIAPRHADRGRSRLAYDITRLGPLADTRAILALVGHHHDPKQLVRRDASLPAYRRLARLADPELLYLLELADVRGRTCEDKQEQLDIIELFRMQSEEFEVWRLSPYAGWADEIDDALAGAEAMTRRFVTAEAIRSHEGGLITMPAEEVARSYGYREAYSHLVVLSGPSGVGKSTYIERNYPSYDSVSMDELREELTGDRADQSQNGKVLQAAKERLKESLRANRDVVWDATNLRRDFRRLPIGLGYDYGAFVTLVAFQVPREVCAARNRERAHPVPQVVLDRQFETAELPYEDEAHEVVWANTRPDG